MKRIEQADWSTRNYSIKDWIELSKNYDPHLDLEKLSNYSKKKLKKKAKLKMDEDGRYIISSRHKKYIDLVDYYDDPERYFNDVYFFIYSIKHDIFNDECRENYVSFIFPEEDSDKIRRMSSIHFLFNMIIWMPFFILGIPINKKRIFMPEKFVNSSYKYFIENKIIEPLKHLTTHNEMSEILSKMYDLYVRISELYGLQLGISFSLYDIISKWDDPELYELNHTKIPKNYQMAEMEDYISKQAKRFSEIWLNLDTEDDSLKTFIRAGQVNAKQMKEFAINIGTKPDLQGNTYSHIPGPGSNLVVKGLRHPNNFVSDATGGRKAAVLGLQIDDGGYLARTFGKSCSSVHLCEDPDYDCGSKNYYICTINNKEELEEMRGRWYLDENDYHLKQLIDTDYEMIGKTLKFRSPATCAGGKHGVCATCYGHLYNQNIHINVGVNSSLKLSEKNYQNQMSAKHALDTKTNSIEFNEEFDELFELEEGYRILLRDDIDNIEDYEIWLNINLVQREKDIEDLMHNEYVSDFLIYNKDKKQKITMSDVSKTEMYLANQLFEKFAYARRIKDYNAKGWIKIPLSKLSSEKDLFFVRLSNDELAKPLKELKSLIEKGRDLGIHDVSELIDKIKRLMKAGGIHSESIHMEVLARNLIRDKNNKMNLPDWSKPDPEYIITSVHNSIFWSDSVINSLTFEKIKLQLRNPMTYNKTGTSFMDTCFILDYEDQKKR